MLIRSARDAEEAAAAWMRVHGFEDAALTGLGADGGIDVIAQGAVAQVKAQVGRTPRSEVQQLFGIAASQSKLPLFFSLGGYARTALEWADQQGVALFTFDLQSAVEPANELARTLHAHTAVPRGRRERRSVEEAKQARFDASPAGRILAQMPAGSRDQAVAMRAATALDGAPIRAIAMGEAKALFGRGIQLLVVGPGVLVGASTRNESVRRVERADLAVGTPKLGPLIAVVTVDCDRSQSDLRVTGSKQVRAQFMQALQYAL